MRKAILIAAVALVALAVAPAMWLVLDNGGDRRVGALDRAAASGSWALDVDGVKAGTVQSLSGCNAHAEVIDQAIGPDYYVKKHIGQPKYRECVFEVGAIESKTFWQWLQASMQQNYTRKNVSLTQGTVRYDLFNVLITGLEIPELRADATNPVFLKVTLAPEWIRKQQSGGKVDPPATPEGLSPSTVEFELDGIRRLEGLSSLGPWKYEVPPVVDTVGELRDYVQEPGRLNFGSIGVRLSETAPTSVPAMDAFFDDFVVAGDNADASEKNGTLILSSASGKVVQLNLFNVGIFDTGPARANVRGYDLYVERATIVGPVP